MVLSHVAATSQDGGEAKTRPSLFHSQDGSQARIVHVFLPAI